jgi:hypothetical protein
MRKVQTDHFFGRHFILLLEAAGWLVERPREKKN